MGVCDTAGLEHETGAPSALAAVHRAEPSHLAKLLATAASPWVPEIVSWLVPLRIR